MWQAEATLSQVLESLKHEACDLVAKPNMWWRIYIAALQ